jgi:AAA domain
VTGEWYDTEPAGDPAQDEQDTLAAIKLCLYDDTTLGQIPAPQPLIDGWLALDTLAWLFGERGHCKSFVALDMAACVANGIDWHGYPVKQTRVLYAVLEGAAGVHARTQTWRAYYQQPSTGIDFLVPRPPLQIVRDATVLTALAAESGAGLIVIDTQNRATVGLDENSNVDMGRMIAALDMVRDRTGACVLVVHHSSVGTHRPRGHSSIDGAATTMIRVAKDGRLIKVENGKQREGDRAASVLLTLSNHDLGVVLTPSSANSPTDSETRICACLRDLAATKDKVTHTDLKRACTSLGMADSTFNWALRKLIEAGRITRGGSSYAIVPLGQGRFDDQ